MNSLSRSFKAFLIEGEKQTELSRDEIKDYLRKNCMPACRLMHESNNLIFRGLTGTNAIYKLNLNVDTKVEFEMSIEQVRKDRKPRDTPQSTHDLMNAWFKTEFGWPARSEGLFVTSNYVEANEYGKPHVIFPIGAVEGAVSSVVDDLLTYIFTFGFSAYDTNTHIPGGMGFWKTRGYSDIADIPQAEIEDYVITKLNAAAYKFGDIEPTDLHRHSEIMLKCDKYIAISFGKSSRGILELKRLVSEVVEND